MMTIVKNKNGILLPETLKIILAVIGIGILCYLVFSFYGIFVKSSGLKQAEINLGKIGNAIEKVELKEGPQEIFLESPKGWWLISWPFSKLAGKPSKCGEFCICLCPGDSLEKCDKKGACKDVSMQVNIEEGIFWKEMPLNVDGLINLKISLGNNEIIIDEVKK